jgi:hypothetical protein
MAPRVFLEVRVAVTAGEVTGSVETHGLRVSRCGGPPLGPWKAAFLDAGAGGVMFWTLAGMPLAEGPMTPRFDDVWRENPELYAVLREAPTLGSARKRVFDYLNQRELVFLDHDFDTHALEFATVLDCVDVMKQVISVRSEEVAGCSALSHLHDAAHGMEPRDELAPGFIEEFRHLFRALRGQSKLYPEPAARVPRRLSGRAAARARSRGLDELAEHVDEGIRSFPTGLDADVASRRRCQE